MTAPMPYRDVMGMRIPLPLVARIIAALRAEYPDVVEGKDNDAAVRAVVRYWVTTTLVNYEARTAAAAARETAAQATAAVETAAAEAFQKAKDDAQLITEITA